MTASLYNLVVYDDDDDDDDVWHAAARHQ